jgi:hypothetical protein
VTNNRPPNAADSGAEGVDWILEALRVGGTADLGQLFGIPVVDDWSGMGTQLGSLNPAHTEASGST